MLKLTVSTIGKRLHLSGDTYQIKDKLQKLPSCRWEKGVKRWSMAKTVGAARTIYFFVHENNIKASGDKEFQTLLALGRAQDAAQEIKKHRCDPNCPEWHHQPEALKFILPQQASILMMPTGTGKTKIYIDLICQRRPRLTLILTKKKSIKNFPRGFARFASIPIVCAALDTGSIEKNLKIARDAIENSTGRPVVLVINYQAVWRDPLAAWLLDQQIDQIVIDESHMIKDSGSTVSEFMVKMSERCQTIIAGTATFMGNRPGADIFGQMKVVDPGVFGTSFKKFADEFLIMGGFNNKQILAYRHPDIMMSKLSPYIFEVDKSVLKLLPMRHKHYFFDLNPVAQKIYDAMEKDAFAALRDDISVSADNILTKILRCQQITAGYVSVDDGFICRDCKAIYTDDDKGSVFSGCPFCGAEPERIKKKYKIEYIDNNRREFLKSIIQELPETAGVPQGVPLVVYYKFEPDTQAIMSVARELHYSYCELSGNVDEQDKFVNGEGNLLACQISAGGTGVDGLQDVAHVAIYYNTGHSLIEFIQSQGRLDRPGQMNSVLNLYIAAAGTVDIDIIDSLREGNDVIMSLMSKARALPQNL
jgi:SNF2 family DNA or RNA helicase